ncbi:MAG: S49 family peptidase [Alphaproteobacteria bacterium]
MAFFNTFLKTIGILIGFSTFVIILTVFLAILPKNDGDFNFSEGDRQSENIIAVINLNGPIIKNINQNFIGNIIDYINPEIVKKSLKNLEELNPKIVIIRINSPGGTVTATATLEKIIREFKNKTNTKIYFYSDEILASGGYWVSTSGDKIYTNYGSIIGSIGVSGPTWYYYNQPKSISNNFFGQSIETEKGIEVFNQNAGISKDLFNPFRKPTSQELSHLESMVKEIYDDFIMKVSSSRKIERNNLINDIGALIFTSNQAKKKFLVDDVINFEDLINKIAIEEKYSDYKIIQKNLEKGFIKNFISNYFSKEDTLICNELNSNFSTIFPIFLNNC